MEAAPEKCSTARWALTRRIQHSPVPSSVLLLDIYFCREFKQREHDYNVAHMLHR